MPTTPTLLLDLPQKYLEQVEAILRAHVPYTEVWAYGSRVAGGSHPGSDLDLVVRNPCDLRREQPRLYRLTDALSESDLPILVEVHDWARLPESFHRQIERAHVVVQEGPVAVAGK